MENRMTKRKSYTSNFKISVCERAEKIGNRATAREFGIDERNVRRWRSEKESLEKMPKLKRARRRGTVCYPFLEASLENWIKEQRDKGLPVSTVRIRLQAKLIAQQLGLENFKGGSNWCYRFMKRKKLSVRVRTTIGQALPTDYEEKQASFRDYIHTVIKEQKFPDSHVINMDEVPLTFDCPPNRTVDSKGVKTITVATTGNERTAFTCVLACAANGDKLKPLLIFKRKTVPKGNYPPDVLICANQKGWMCEKIMLHWLNEVWRKRKGAFFQPRGILIVDSMRAHLMESVKSECKKVSAILAVIPGGLTKILQPLDLAVNKAFKNEMRKHWEKWMREGMHSYTKSGRMKKATYEKVAEWVSKSWRSVKVSTIISGFAKANIISPDCDNTSESSESDESDFTEVSDDELLKLFHSDSDISDFDGFE